MIQLTNQLRIDEAKRDARARALAARVGCDPALGRQVGVHLLRLMPPPEGAVVAGFWPMDGEIDIRPLLHHLHHVGHKIVLPETPEAGNPLTFRLWQPDSRMIREGFGTYRPDGEIQLPDFLLVPLLAFDRNGHRLGYGGGFYDRTLAQLRDRTAVGCAFAAQMLDAVPVGDYDALLDAVATETGVLLFER
jgi:5-formyltetrahydrofolate cyclo-ligase